MASLLPLKEPALDRPLFWPDTEAMEYEGPIYRPPSEARSLLVQATVGCPHNKCSFCLVYKKGPPFRIRPTAEIKADIDEAASNGWRETTTLFLPAGNTIAMPTGELAEVCRHAHRILPKLKRITVYGSSAYIDAKSLDELKGLAEAGLSRIHVGLESGDAEVLRRVKKGVNPEQQVAAAKKVLQAGLELSLYIMLGLGGQELTEEHALATADVLNRIGRADFVRLRTLVPKSNTLLLHQMRKGRFRLLGPHGVLKECRLLLEKTGIETELTSDHYTNYIDLSGRLPGEKERLLAQIDAALKRPESSFRPFFIGDQ